MNGTPFHAADVIFIHGVWLGRRSILLSANQPSTAPRASAFTRMEMTDEHFDLAPLTVGTIAIVGIIWSVLVLAIRLYLRLKLSGPVGNDDYAAIAATALAVAQSSLVLAGISAGLGSPASGHSDLELNPILMVLEILTEWLLCITDNITSSSARSRLLYIC